MSENTMIQPMKLTFSQDGDTWGETVAYLDGTIIYQRLGIILFDYQINKEYFDNAMQRIKNYTNQQKLF